MSTRHGELGVGGSLEICLMVSHALQMLCVMSVEVSSETT